MKREKILEAIKKQDCHSNDFFEIFDYCCQRLLGERKLSEDILIDRIYETSIDIDNLY